MISSRAVCGIRPAAMAIVSAVLALAGGCITERTIVRPTPPGSTTGDPASARRAASDAAGPAPTAIDPGPRFSAGVRWLGFVRYDGWTLPLVSPDGRYVAVQQGPALSLSEAVLAAPAPPLPAFLNKPSGAKTAAERLIPAPARHTVAVYEVGAAGLRAINWSESAETLPDDLILGRCADAQGVLVEAPQADGGRWIGRLRWDSGRVDWLVQPAAGQAAAHAVVRDDGSILYCLRPAGPGEITLHFRTQDGASDRAVEDAGAPGTRVYPVLSPDQSIASVLCVSARGLEVEIWSLPGAMSKGLDATLVERRELLQNATIQSVFDAGSAVAALPRSGIRLLGASVCYFDPVAGAMAIFFAADRRHLAMARGVVSAAPIETETRAGLLLTSAASLDLQWLADAAGRFNPGGRSALMGRPIVVPAQKIGSSPVVAIGPGPRGGVPQLEIGVIEIKGQPEVAK